MATAVSEHAFDLAKKAGITTPPTDWAGLKDMAKAMQDKAGAKFGIGLQAGGQLDSPAAAAARLIDYLDRADFGANPVADVRDP